MKVKFLLVTGPRPVALPLNAARLVSNVPYSFRVDVMLNFDTINVPAPSLSPIKKPWVNPWLYILQLSYSRQNPYLPSAIRWFAINRLASLLLKGSDFVKRFSPSNIIFCSSPPAKELIASFPHLAIVSKASFR